MTQSITRALLGAALLFGVSAAPVLAAGNDIDLSGIATQGQFDALMEEVGVAIAYNPLAPAEPEGLVGFQLGVSLTTVKIDSALWNLAVADGAAPSNLLVPRLHARKGLPFGIDIAASYLAVPSTNITVIGGELRKAVLEGGAATPAVGITLHGSKLTGVDALDASTYGIGAGISKGFLMFTPYAGVDQIWFSGSENVAGITLADAEDSFLRTHVGVKFSLALINFTAQADFGPANTYSLRANIGL